MKKNILITGGAGFVGANFLTLLFQKCPAYHVVVLDALTYAGNPQNFITNAPWERLLPMRQVPIMTKNGNTEYY